MVVSGAMVVERRATLPRRYRIEPPTIDEDNRDRGKATDEIEIGVLRSGRQDSYKVGFRNYFNGPVPGNVDLPIPYGASRGVRQRRAVQPVA